LNAQLQWLTFTPNDVWLRIDIADSYSRLQRIEEGLAMLTYQVENADEQKTLNDARVFLIEHNGFPKRAAELCMDLAEQSEQLDLNVARFMGTIRTAWKQGDNWQMQVGAGIVADSVPAAEYQETLQKATGMLPALVQSATG